MKDYLQDIVQHTHALGVIDLVKITGTDQETVISTIAEDRSIIVQAKFKNPVPEFVGTFGMPNLGKLNTILNIPEYKEDAKLTINKQNRNNEEVPVGIHFENKNGDFKNDYRFMTSEIINEKLKNVKMAKQVKWSVEFNPAVANIQRMKFQASANSEETTFVAKTEKNNLVFYFGDHSSHAGDFVFQSDITGTINKGWNWPINAVISILGLSGDKSMKISDDGVMQITVDSGIAEYNYLLPAQSK
jgi:hypothetical protein